jgi:hypothetical protein
METLSCAGCRKLDNRKIKSIKFRINHRVVSNPVWDVVQPQNYIFPELHAEIGLVNNVLDNFYTFIDDQVEALTPEELTSRNSFIVADVVLKSWM